MKKTMGRFHNYTISAKM